MTTSAQSEATPPSIVSDCWNRIGIRGDLSCPELKRQTHCRNCPTYALAALALLDRALPPDYRAEQSVHLGQPAATEAVDRRTAFIFRISTEWFALPVPLLVEVASPRVLHSLPHRRSGIVMGLVDVRGELLICISLSKLLGLDDTIAPDGAGSDATYPRLVVIRHGSWRTVFPVSEVGGIHRYHEQELNEVPVTVAKGASSYTNAILPWAGKSVGSLDEQSLIETLNQSFA